MMDEQPHAAQPYAAQPPASQPLISVVIPAHDAGAFLSETLDSVLAQRHVPFEIIVVNDGSRDDTAALLQRAAAQHAITVITHTEGRGPSAARNAGWRTATSPWVAFVDADDVWHPLHLQSLVSVIAQHPGASVVYADLVPFHQSPPRFAEQEVVRGQPPRLLVNGPFDVFSSARITQSAVLVRREMLEGVHGYDEMRRYAEDLDLWARISLRGEIVHLPVATIAYRMHTAQVTVTRAAEMYAAGWDVRARLRRQCGQLSDRQRRDWNNAEHRLLATDLQWAWNSGDIRLLNCMIDIARQSEIGKSLARRWAMKRRLTWHGTQLLRRAIRSLRARNRAA